MFLYIDDVSLNPNTLNSLLSAYLETNNLLSQHSLMAVQCMLNHESKIKSWFTLEVIFVVLIILRKFVIDYMLEMSFS